MVLWVAKLRTGERIFVSMLGGLEFEFERGRGDLTLDRLCLLEPPPGRDDNSPPCGRFGSLRLRLGVLLLLLLFSIRRDVAELLQRPGEVYQLTVLSPVDDLSCPPLS